MLLKAEIKGFKGFFPYVLIDFFGANIQFNFRHLKPENLDLNVVDDFKSLRVEFLL